ncbi:SDR family oxidoreductase [Kitasatospora aureofaciens]|uniref:Oxidoreductase n=1 Tax=Kitasatospora aureofaciens TaxID=1894 RepID=A0A1E7N4N2_KITAU|nr:SDR family oxidoreductase [Kitasatospora aureofaciens]ARF80842.1 short-chain dehydrogenase [Kitasatospora aureofaciens]OEV35649.1 short-chain dehydrogenase [Kitasatospora aureofaciens]GGU62476.1 oxidoreductase [Kitasatospora aureofaciens]
MLTNTLSRPLTGRVAVVTGASSGIGEASAEKLASLGARVVVLARRAERLAELVGRIEENGGAASAIAVDVTEAAAVQAAAERVEAEFGGADLLLNNAGVMLPAPIEELATGQWKQQIDLNITGLMNAIGAFTPQLVKAAAERGVADLINTSSIAAQNIFPNFAVYSGTKAYVSHLSRHLRAELGAKKVRVSAVEPGIVGTELQSHVTDQGALEWLEGSKETVEWLTPEDVAEMVGVIATLPARVNLQQVTIMPTGQAS